MQLIITRAMLGLAFAVLNVGLSVYSIQPRSGLSNSMTVMDCTLRQFVNQPDLGWKRKCDLG